MELSRRLTPGIASDSGRAWALRSPLTVMTVETPLMMKVMTVALLPGRFPAPGRRAIRESLTRLSH
ncbi:MAG: hypothetical protein AW12_02153 [Candidatus Accumulibacter sp. BA-94]|nr:MAG: hypothetical protein AW12_02153 [Candidatus Accumulibacter sp. BA-94]